MMWTRVPRSGVNIRIQKALPGHPGVYSGQNAKREAGFHVTAGSKPHANSPDVTKDEDSPGAVGIRRVGGPVENVPSHRLGFRGRQNGAVCLTG
jgi:hypothetical protein